MSDVSSVINYFARANEGFSTTLGTTITSGASTIPLNGTSGLTDGSIFVGIIEPGATNQQVFTGTVDVSGSQITGVVWTRGTNVPHTAGVTIVDYTTGTGFNMVTSGILKQHTQTGAHRNITNTGGMSNTGGLTTDTLHVTSTTVLDGAITGDGYSMETMHNPSKFSVWRSASYTVGTPTYPLIFDTKLWDTGNEYSTSTGLFTANQDGFYRFSARGAIGAGAYHGSGVGISLTVNGASYKEGDSFIMTYDNWETGVRVEGSIQLSAGDIVGVSFYGSGLPGQTTSEVYTWFDGEMISPT